MFNDRRCGVLHSGSAVEVGVSKISAASRRLGVFGVIHGSCSNKTEMLFMLEQGDDSNGRTRCVGVIGVGDSNALLSICGGGR